MTRMPTLPPIVQMTDQEKEEFRKAEAAYLSDRFANPRDKSRAIDGEDSVQVSLAQSIDMFQHTPVTSYQTLTEMLRFSQYFGIDNKIKI